MPIDWGSWWRRLSRYIKSLYRRIFKDTIINTPFQRNRTREVTVSSEEGEPQTVEHTSGEPTGHTITKRKKRFLKILAILMSLPFFALSFFIAAGSTIKLYHELIDPINKEYYFNLPVLLHVSDQYFIALTILLVSIGIHITISNSLTRIGTFNFDNIQLDRIVEPSIVKMVILTLSITFLTYILRNTIEENTRLKPENISDASSQLGTILDPNGTLILGITISLVIAALSFFLYVINKNKKDKE